MLKNDLAAAVKRLQRKPGFLLLGSVALAIGLAATLLVFSLVNLLLLSEPPGLHPSAPLVELGRSDQGNGGFDTFSYPDFRDIASESRTLDRVFAHRSGTGYLNTGSTSFKTLLQFVSGEYFDALGTSAVDGQLFDQSVDAAPGAAPVVVASYAAFERYFGARRDLIGSVVRLNGAQLTLVGVLEPEFHGHQAGLNPDFYVPMTMMEALQGISGEFWDSRGWGAITLGGRLAPGANLDAAKAEMHTLASNLESQYPDTNEGRGFEVAVMRAIPHLAVAPVVAMSAVLFILCGAILLLACSNLAGVLLAQGEARRAEIALRGMLGASRRRIVQQLLLEAGIVALVAGGLALMLTWMGRDLLNSVSLPIDFPIDLRLPIDAKLTAFCFGVTGVVALLFGLLPALRTASAAPGNQLRESAGSGVSANRQRLRMVLLSMQTALTVALLFSSALIVRGLGNANAVDTGFNGDAVSVAELDLEPLGLDAAASAEPMSQLMQRLEADPSIRIASYATVLPLSLSSKGFGGFRATGTDAEFQRLNVNTVGASFFDVFEIPVQGRAILDSDVKDGERVAVVNQIVADRLTGGEGSAIGKIFDLGQTETSTVRVVGVVPNGRYNSFADVGSPFAFLPNRQWIGSSFHVFVSTSLSPEQLQRRLKAEVAAIFPDLPAPQVRRFNDVSQVSLLPQRVLAFATSALGVLALILAATGMYGALAYQVQRRYREFGIRKALGARGGRIARTLLRSAGPWVLAGVAVGLLLGQVAALALGDRNFGVTGSDPLALISVIGTFALIVITASFGPLRQVLRLPPMEALRYE